MKGVYIMLIDESLINDAFNSWLEKHGFDARIRGLEEEFFWGSETDTIAYCFVHPEKFIEDFTFVCQDIGLQYEIDIFWLSFFHELGHSQTYHFIEDDEAWEADFLSGMDYYYCNREYYATEWAVNFINTHIDWVIELMECVRPAIVNFFAKNSIVDDEGAPIIPS